MLLVFGESMQQLLLCDSMQQNVPTNIKIHKHTQERLLYKAVHVFVQ